MRRRGPRAGAVLLAPALAAVLLGVPAGAAGPAPAPAPAPAPGDPRDRPVHSSDGEPGRPTAGLPGPAPRAAVARSEVTAYRVAPGLRYRSWTETDARGPVRVHLLRANLARPGLRLSYAGAPHVAERAPLTSLLAPDAAVAGVNGDFFDIAGTGAPLGVGVDETLVRHGPRQGWNTSFVVVRRAAARIATVPVVATVPNRPRLTVTGVNSPGIPPGGIGLYTPEWGAAPGLAVTPGARKRDVRQVLVRGGRVVANTRAVTVDEPVAGRLLLGREAGADALRRLLPVGSQVRFTVGAEGLPRAPRVVLSGSLRLLEGGRVVARDDTELHPRTAVGVDTDTGRVLLVVVDGRQESSRGHSLRELARLLRGLGAEEALNLDGGGSSTMVVTGPRGRVKVANAPSDGTERPIPNGLQLTYSPPR